jgi:hypothetical protein
MITCIGDNIGFWAKEFSNYKIIVNAFILSSKEYENEKLLFQT